MFYRITFENVLEGRKPKEGGSKLITFLLFGRFANIKIYIVVVIKTMLHQICACRLVSNKDHLMLVKLVSVVLLLQIVLVYLSISREKFQIHLLIFINIILKKLRSDMNVTVICIQLLIMFQSLFQYTKKSVKIISAYQRQKFTQKQNLAFRSRRSYLPSIQIESISFN